MLGSRDPPDYGRPIGGRSRLKAEEIGLEGQGKDAEAPLEHLTIIDVARAAGVSPATVSRAMNTPSMVSAKTLQKIRAVLAETAYVPNSMARGLASSRSRTIAFFVPSVGLGLFESSILFIAQAMAQNDYQVLLGFGGRTDEEFNAALVRALTSRPDGIILIGVTVQDSTRAHLRRARVPVLQAWELPAEPVDMVVGFSHEQVGRALGDFLLENGYKRPHLVWAQGRLPLATRYGLTLRLVEAGYPEPGITQFPFPSTFADGAAAFQQIFDGSGPPPDSLVCISDAAAHGAMVAATRRGLRVPEDVAIIGFGDLDFAAGLWPSLTTVRIDGQEIAAQASRMMLARLQGEAPPARIVDVGFTLARRESA